MPPQKAKFENQLVSSSRVNATDTTHPKKGPGQPQFSPHHLHHRTNPPPSKPTTNQTLPSSLHPKTSVSYIQNHTLTNLTPQHQSQHQLYPTTTAAPHPAPTKHHPHNQPPHPQHITQQSTCSLGGCVSTATQVSATNVAMRSDGALQR